MDADRTASTKVLAFAICAICAIALAALFDRAVAQWAHDSGASQFLITHKWLRECLKAPGFYVFTIVLAVAMSVLHRANWRAAMFLLIATATSGLNEALKWMVGRTRPFKLESMHDRLAPFQLHPFAGGKNLCFPSGHATLAFATAAALAILWPRARAALFVLASFVAVERFVETAHWLSDCVAGAILGVVGVWFVAKLLRSWMTRFHISRS